MSNSLRVEMATVAEYMQCRTMNGWIEEITTPGSTVGTLAQMLFSLFVPEGLVSYGCNLLDINCKQSVPNITWNLPLSKSRHKMSRLASWTAIWEG